MTDPITGLTPDDAARRLAQDGPNALPEAERLGVLRLIVQTVREPMVLMLLLAGGLYLLLGDAAEALMLLVAVLAVVVLTLSQSLRSQRALEALRELSAPRARVLRGGQPERVPSAELVVGDVLILDEGERLPADAQLLTGQLRVDESLLTGESAPMQKLPAPDPAPELPELPELPESAQLFAGTLITQGSGLARVLATGSRSSMGRIGQSLRALHPQPTPLQQASERLVRRVAWVGGAVSLAVVALAWAWDGRSLLQSLLLGIATAMALLPEEIPVVLTVFLALGAWRLSQRQVLTRRLAAIETLGAITVLAVDKTGTLTHNRMRVAMLDNLRQQHTEGPLPEDLHDLLEFALLATPQNPYDPMEQALQAHGQAHLARTEHLHLDWAPVRAYELSPDILAMTHAYLPDAQGVHGLATKGAPEAVADLCHLDAAALAHVRAHIEAMASQGLRVLGVARGRWSGNDWPASQHDFQFEFLGLIGLIDPPREDVPQALAECRSAGVRVMMLTGDHPATARAIAQQVGLATEAAVLTGAELDALDDAALAQRLHHTQICARVKPHHKLRLVQALQARGEVVAMTGDGVNDGPALRAANVGIAMGQRGTDVAREAASIVLLDDRFASIVAGIRQGRQIDHNLRRAIAFVFAVHVPIVLLALAPVALHWPLLLLPAQIVLLELVIDPACSVFFEAEPAPPDLMQRPPHPASDSALGLPVLVQGLWQGALSALVLVGGAAVLNALAQPERQVRTALFLALVLGLLVQLLPPRGRRAPNPWWPRISGAVLLGLGVILWLPPLRDTLGLALPTPALAVSAIGMAALQWALWRWAGRRAR